EWFGNIRELENTIEYYSLMNDWETLPKDTSFLEGNSNLENVFTEKKQLHSVLPIEGLDIDNSILILQLLLKANKNGSSAGRRSLVRMARQEGVIISENSVRKIMNHLE